MDITKDQISELEFSTAVFTNGVTVYSPMLPRYAFSYLKVNGVVDLTRVQILDDLNLLYKINSSCTVKLSTALKTISPKSFKHTPTTTRVEYDGTIKEFSELISTH